MASIRPLHAALQGALIRAGAMRASPGTVPMCTGTFPLPPWLGFTSFCISTLHKAYHTESGASTVYPYIPPSPPKPPQVIAWHPFLANRINILGNLTQNVDITYLDSGHARGTCTLIMSHFKGQYTVFEVEIWDELAEVAAAHMKVGDFVHIAGILDCVCTSGEALRTNYQWKVTATKLNFAVRKRNEMSCESMQENVQVVSENIEKSSVKDEGLRMECESTQKVVLAVDEDVEKTHESTQKFVLAVDEDMEKTPRQDDYVRKVVEQ